MAKNCNSTLSKDTRAQLKKRAKFHTIHVIDKQLT